MEISYDSKDRSKKAVSVMKKGFILEQMMTPGALNGPIGLPPKKKIDIESLIISRLGNDWKNRGEVGEFYSHILSLETPEIDEDEGNEGNNSDVDSDAESRYCDCLCEDPCIH